MGTRLLSACIYSAISLYILTNLYACELLNKEEEITLNLGDYHQGGYIFHFFEEGELGYVKGEQHGLIVSVQDIDITYWGCDQKVIGTESAVGTGKSNSNKILSMCPQLNHAVHICQKYSYDGYNDYYLPSLEEAKIFYKRKDLLFNAFEHIPESYIYWTSSENMDIVNSNPNIKPAIAIKYSTGDIFKTVDKLSELTIRPIRSF